MQQSTINKILLARRLHQLASENLLSSNDLSLAIGVNLLQDSVEAFLLAASEYLNAGIRDKTTFPEYFDLINNKIAPKELPFRPRLNALNKLRINSKHYGLVPAKSETDGLSLIVSEFFQEVCKEVFKKDFSSITLIDLINDGEAKDFLKEAEEAFNNNGFEKCLIDCRKSFFVRFESDYDIKPLSKETLHALAMTILGFKAPYYARDKKYIEENVKEPTDYIVFDHNTLEMDLMKKGIGSTSFWNVWRLTPAVYRHGSQGDWIIKHELNKLEEEGIKERAEYVLDTTINILVIADNKLKKSKTLTHNKYFIDLKHEKVPVYEKADRASKVVQHTPENLLKIYVDSSVTSLDGANIFWEVSHFEDDVYIQGFIDNDDRASNGSAATGGTEDSDVNQQSGNP